MSTDCKRRYVLVVDGNLSKGEKGDQGEPGQDAISALPISSDDVLYGFDTLTDIIDQLLYEYLEILSFSAFQTLYEKGQVLTSIALIWTYNKAITAGSQTITGTGVIPPTLLLSDRNATVTLDDVSINTTIILTADDVSADANPPIIANVNIQFTNKIYYGKYVYPGALNSAFILSLSFSSLQADRNIEFSINTSTDEYIWFALPVAYGEPIFVANGFEGGFELESTFEFTNASGYAEEYNLYKSINTNLGITNIQIL